MYLGATAAEGEGEEGEEEGSEGSLIARSMALTIAGIGGGGGFLGGVVVGLSAFFDIASIGRAVGGGFGGHLCGGFGG